MVGEIGQDGNALALADPDDPVGAGGGQVVRAAERSNLTIACAVAVMYLNASGIPANPTRDQLAALAHELYNPHTTTARISGLLRTWKP